MRTFGTSLPVRQLLKEFNSVIMDKVRRLLSSSPAKSAPVDFSPTKLLQMHCDVFAPIYISSRKIPSLGQLSKCMHGYGS